MAAQYSENAINVVSYNVLSPELRAPTYHIHCKAEDLDAEKSFQKILVKLEKEGVAKSAIVCLQEVGLTWVGRLDMFFRQHRYVLLQTSYGNVFSGYMGVVIAFPEILYSLQDVQYVNLVDGAKEVPASSEENKSDQRLEEKKAVHRVLSLENIRKQVTRCYDRVRKSLGRGLDWAGYIALPCILYHKIFAEKPKRLVEGGWQIATTRSNRAIFARLARKDCPDHEFVVACYHMPCLFGTLEKVKALALHTSWLLHQSEAFAADASSSANRAVPRIVCGDFNFKPRAIPVDEGGDSPFDGKVYELVTKEGISALAVKENGSTGIQNDLQLFKGLHVLKGAYTEKSCTFAPLDSGYAKFLGKESECTTLASCHKEGDPDFCATLDYIFLSRDHWDVKGVVPLLTEKETRAQGVMPNATEPSDHMLIGCELEFKKTTG